jgi:hypothetical protein
MSWVTAVRVTPYVMSLMVLSTKFVKVQSLTTSKVNVEVVMRFVDVVGSTYGIIEVVLIV